MKTQNVICQKLNRIDIGQTSKLKMILISEQLVIHVMSRLAIEKRYCKQGELAGEFYRDVVGSAICLNSLAARVCL